MEQEEERKLFCLVTQFDDLRIVNITNVSIERTLQSFVIGFLLLFQNMTEMNYKQELQL